MYTEQQVETVLNQIGVEIVSETMTNFLALCPVHGNTNTPALSIEKTEGVFMCWNSSCGISGKLEDLVRLTTKKDEFQIARLILKAKAGGDSISTQVQRSLRKPQEFVRYNENMLSRMAEQMWQEEAGREYMHSRGFEDETLKEFEVGYSVKRNMIVVPMHDPTGMPVGFIGRKASHTDKVFKNSKNLPSSLTLWNLHRAKKTGGTIIICESCFDAMRVHQAGFPNVVASLGGYWNTHRRDLIERYFNTVIIMTDDDKLRIETPCQSCLSKGNRRCVGHLDGESLGMKIADSLPGKRVKWATASDIQSVYSKRFYSKDACGMTEPQIRDCISNAVPHIEYRKTAHTLVAA